MAGKQLIGKPLRVLVTITSVFGFLLFGYDQGLMSGIIVGTSFNNEFPATKGTDIHTSTIQGAVTASYEVGCLFGAIFALVMGERLGRRMIVLIGAPIMIVGTIISATAFGPYWGLGQFVVGRVITGVGNGANTATIPTYQSECSKAHNRGILVCMEGSVIAVGTFIAYWIDFGCSFAGSSVQWRFPVAFQIFFAILIILGMLYLPESPRFLLAHHREEEALHVLAALNGTGIHDKDTIEEKKVILEGVHKSGRQAGFSDLFVGGKKQNLQRMIVGASTQFFQQWSGCNAAIYYASLIFENSIGLPHQLALILGGVFATVYALSTIPCFFMIETVGRRKMFLIGALGQGLSFMITMACLINPTAQNAKGAVVGLYLFIVFFAFTILSLPWLYPAELNSLATRSKANAVSTMTNWITNAAVVLITPLFIASKGYGCFLFFAVINFAFIPVIYFFYCETAGRTLEEVDIIYAKAYVEKKSAYKVAHQLPKLSNHEIEQAAHELGLYEVEDDMENSSPVARSSASTTVEENQEQEKKSAAQNGEAMEETH